MNTYFSQNHKYITFRCRDNRHEFDFFNIVYGVHDIMYFTTKVNKSNAQHAARNSPSKNLCSVDNRLRKIYAKGKLHGASMHFYYIAL